MTAGSCIPFSEELVYGYLCFLRREAALASRGQSFLEAVGFTTTLLAVEQTEDVVSPRVPGASHQLWGTKRVLRPRDPFTKEMVAVLEELTETHPDYRARIFTGFVCCLTHMRCRVSDAQRALRAQD